MVEVILAMLMSSLICIYAAESMMQNIDAYSFHSRQHDTLSDIRHAANRLVFELMDLGPGDITNISTTQINFTDSDGNAANFSLAVADGQLTLFRNNLPLIDRIDSMTFKYYDNNGNELIADPINIGSVSRIGISITTQPIDNEGEFTLETTVVPRSFLGYGGFMQE